ncbi:tRNA lysidine(34) synthetase TilS [Henriciella marina]|uniref:tRNA lysidine(34) synthetase TilS n=1 Tax=Henriciella marina TaxID=453851 RepID=UPI0003601504|nr:tRNA lysidine(34) synthetase TilS [Henriciella marina]
MQRLEALSHQFIDTMTAGSTGPVCVAVSGGSDSLNLLDLAGSWARSSGRKLMVLTVDHGLRAEAGAEAEWVAAQARELGHRAEILRWKPDKHGQNAARRARHSLLADAARAAGSQRILLGHTQSDVIETLFMRLSRPTRLAGAVGPQPVSVSPIWPEGRGVQIGRPLIAWPRDVLMTRLESAGRDWVRDPSNVSEAYERVRVRALAAQLDGARLQRVAGDAMRLRALEDWMLAKLLQTRAHDDESGLIEVSLDETPVSRTVFNRFLDILLQTASGTSHGAASASLDALGLEIQSGGPQSRVTLGGAWLQRRGCVLSIGRDPGEMRAGWHSGLWDGRYGQGDCQPSAGEDIPFLVRHAMPDQPFRQILSERLDAWATALGLGADLAVQSVDAWIE